MLASWPCASARPSRARGDAPRAFFRRAAPTCELHGQSQAAHHRPSSPSLRQAAQISGTAAGEYAPGPRHGATYGLTFLHAVSTHVAAARVGSRTHPETSCCARYCDGLQLIIVPHPHARVRHRECRGPPRRRGLPGAVRQQRARRCSRHAASAVRVLWPRGLRPERLKRFLAPPPLPSAKPRLAISGRARRLRPSPRPRAAAPAAPVRPWRRPPRLRPPARAVAPPHASSSGAGAATAAPRR